MELTQLLHFKTIAECKTMTEAAERLHISQPALSSSLKKLEEELGVALFERKKNNLVLNKSGTTALDYAGKILAQAEEMKNTFKQYAKEGTLLSLGFCAPGPMRLSVPLFQKAYPHLSVSSEIAADDKNLLNDLLFKKYDAIVSLEKLEHQDVVSIPYAKEELMLSVAVDDVLAKEKSVCLHRHTDREIAAYRCFGAFERHIHTFLDWLNTVPTVTVYTDYFVFRQMLEHKKILTFNTRLVQLYRNDGERVVIPLEDEGISATYWLSYLAENKRRVNPLLEWRKDNSAMLLGSAL
jgi:hypothetical protein